MMRLRNDHFVPLYRLFLDLLLQLNRLWTEGLTIHAVGGEGRDIYGSHIIRS